MRRFRIAWKLRIAVLTAVVCWVPPRFAIAYEFEAKAQTVGQGMTLHALGLGRNTSVLRRRRISQSLQLHLWDLAGTHASFSRWDPALKEGPRVYFSSYLRLDQEQGSFGQGRLLLGGRFRDVVDVIPELERSSLQLDLLYGYVGAEGLWGGAVDVFVGRQMDVQTLDWFRMDGLKVRGHLPWHVNTEAFAGLVVREASWAGTDALEPDGTSSALCEEFVEGALAGSGSWRPIDGLPPVSNNRFTSDDELCPQRDQYMPTFGAAITTEGLRRFVGRIAYRRSHSASPGLLGAPDRLDFEDQGYYPFEAEQASSGVNEERLSISLRGLLGDNRHTPYAAARYSLLHGMIDEAHAGVRLAKHAHSLEPELFYSAPTFDGDSIFNVFSSEPYSDGRLTWRYEPGSGAWHGYLRGWGRRYHDELGGAYVGGGQGGVQLRRQQTQLRFDSFAESGYGGRRIGGVLAGWWQATPKLRVQTRLSLIDFADDSRKSLHGTNLGMQLEARYRVNTGFTTTLMLEQNSNAFDRYALAAFAMIDLAFQPKT